VLKRDRSESEQIGDSEVLLEVETENLLRCRLEAPVGSPGVSPVRLTVPAAPQAERFCIRVSPTCETPTEQERRRTFASGLDLHRYVRLWPVVAIKSIGYLPSPLLSARTSNEHQ